MLSFENITFSYPNQKELINKLSFRIKKGEFISIVGPNGSGKSTISKLINGLLLPNKGKVFFEGLDTSNRSNLNSIRKRVGIVFQNPEDQIVATTVLDEVIFGLENIKCPPEEMIDRIDDSLNKVGMLEYKDYEPYQLSGGQKQRIAVASILAMKPKLIIFDEATSMLDPKGRDQILKVMRNLNKEGFTIINITHHMEEIFESSKVIVLNSGKIVMEGTPFEIFNNSEVITNNNLKLPFVIRIRDKLIKQGLNISNHVISLEELLSELWKYR
ncbi:energy-coupling factor transporter ATPase [Virgibacillus dokdonensis]|uniref:Energy-coupling factor transporter ATP-binding protein EcfA1 n=1 Tax=Virgibacillus dokdonensis TaxID=302167 RepID=A0A2K9IWS1_9BACI|nr:energy-coupling factor transporter ATPase [Virgibacillus dokdonensis]AUJ24127.1 Energy-coupling factor transporter ATP-binding protein EcfA1 [Virgibacillus dokdonensis]